MSARASTQSAGQSGQGARTVRAVTHTALIGLVAGGVAMASTQVAQAVPTAPDNIVVFPQRDFLTLEGYQGHVGDLATVVVKRGAVTTGTAQGTIAEGDPALEVNHPGGVCWQGVTPNIKPGDEVTVSFADGTTDSATTLTPEVTGYAKAGAADLVVRGIRTNAVPRAQIEQRIVAPDLKDTAVGRRDVRAPARPGPYTSTLSFPTATTFTARYHFTDNPGTPAVNEGTQMRNIAAQGQKRVLSWQAVDADGNRQGLTISEFGEVGGPGFGGCPNGPETMAPNAPTRLSATAGNASLAASWTRATTMPDAPVVTGYRVTAVNESSGVQTSVNVPSCTTTCSATVPDLINGTSYSVEVRALSAAGSGAAAVTGPVTPVGGAVQAPAVVTALDGSTDDTTITASVTWDAPLQPDGVSVDGWRVTAFDATSGARIKRVFMDEPLDALDTGRTRTVTFANAGSVFFKVQAISSDEAGSLSAPSSASGSVLAQ